MKVPFLDLRIQYESIKADVHNAIQQVLESSAFAGGMFVEQFEKDFSAFCKCRYAVSVGSGTEALWLALLAMGVGPGDEVITVPNTFIATAEAISFCGAKPVFVDIDENTYTMNPALLENAITTSTKAIIPVHLYGQAAEMKAIMEIARENHLKVIEDASQAHGAEYFGKRVGAIGDVGCFSFYPGKNLGAYGEAGAVVTNNSEIADSVRVLRDHGQTKKYNHRVVGWNARMDGLQGAILSAKLKYLNLWTEARRKSAALYATKLRGIKRIILPTEADYAKHVYHIYAIRIPNRDNVLAGLSNKNIGCGIHYPIPIHLQEAYQFLGLPKNSFPVAEQTSREVLSIPMYAELTEEQIGHVTENLMQLCN